MDVPLAVLADSANVSNDGNLNILGIFDSIFAASYPALHPAATLVVQLRPRRSEAGEKAQVLIRLMDEDNVLAEIRGEFVVPQPTASGQMLGLNQIFRIAPLELRKSGEYAFHILVNSEEKAVVRFHAVVRPSEE